MESTTTIINAENQNSILFWGFSGTDWDKFLIWSVIGAAIAATAVGVATIGSINAHKRETEAAELELKQYKISADSRIASANAAGDSANEAAATANKEAANLKERAARLEKEAADARLQTAQIMKSTAWRQLSQTQISVLTDILSKKPGKILLEWPSNDTEAVALAINFSNVFQVAKWNFTFSVKSSGTTVIWGFVVPDGSSPDIETVRDALTRAGIPFSTDKLPIDNGMTFGNAVGAEGDTAILMIGSRRPTLAQSPD